MRQDNNLELRSAISSFEKPFCLDFLRTFEGFQSSPLFTFLAGISEPQDYTIQAKLNFILGAKSYDTYFLGMHCAEMSDGIAVIDARSEFAAQTGQQALYRSGRD